MISILIYPNKNEETVTLAFKNDQKTKPNKNNDIQLKQKNIYNKTIDMKLNINELILLAKIKPSMIPWILRYSVKNKTDKTIIGCICELIGKTNLKICIDFPLDGYPVIFHAAADSNLEYFSEFIRYGADTESINKDSKTLINYIKTTNDINNTMKNLMIKELSPKMFKNARVVNINHKSIKTNHISLKERKFNERYTKSNK